MFRPCRFLKGLGHDGDQSSIPNATLAVLRKTAWMGGAGLRLGGNVPLKSRDAVGKAPRALWCACPWAVRRLPRFPFGKIHRLMPPKMRPKREKPCQRGRSQAPNAGPCDRLLRDCLRPRKPSLFSSGNGGTVFIKGRAVPKSLPPNLTACPTLPSGL